MMSRWDRMREREKIAKRTLKNCTIAKRYKGFGFKTPIVSSRGQCSGCRNPDDNELEPQCKVCSSNEYHIEEVRA